MKQTFIRLLTSLIVILSNATSIFSADVEYKGIYYNIVGNELSVTYRGSWCGEFDEYRGNIIIPQEVPINKTMYKVTSIGDGAFCDCSSLKTVSIPSSVTTIDHYAFCRCSSLESVSIPNSVIIIGESAFADCSALKSIEIPNGVTWIGKYAFSDCTALETIEIPTSVTYIKDGSFSDCIKLTSINIPNSITKIGNWVFSGCSALESIEIPNSVNFIGSCAFSCCDSLKSIEIPNSVNFIGSRAFNGCNSLTKAVFVDGIVELEILDLDGDSSGDFDLFDFCLLEEVYLGRNLSHGTIFAGQENLKKVSIGNTVTKIENGTFDGCSALESVSIPNSVTSISEYAFYGCSALESVSIPNSVTSIGEYAFYGCSALESVSIPNSVTSIEDGTFDGCSALESVSIPNSVTSIEDGTFCGCSALESVSIPNSVTSIGAYAFDGCSALETLLLGSGLTTVRYAAFSGCTALKVIKSLNSTPPAIGYVTFNGVDKEACQLIVTKGNLAYYRLDKFWQEFLNISDNLLALNPLPIVRYGDGSVNLADYAPEGVSLTYESSNSDVAKIEGSMLTICGAGEATVSASIAEEGTPMEIIGQMRTFIVNKADLTVTAESYEIEQGDPLPDFAIKYDGFVYDDNADSLDELPMIICEATETSKAGEYEISLKGGSDSNYNMNMKNGRLIIKDSSAVDNIESDKIPFRCTVVDREIHIDGLDDSQIVSVYDASGLLCYYGESNNGEILKYRPNKFGMFIVKSRNHHVKVLVK